MFFIVLIRLNQIAVVENLNQECFLRQKICIILDMKNSWLIGDKESDITAANCSGITNTILVKSGHKINESDSKAKYILQSIHQSNQIIIS